jgi:ABC-2 type transport system ATP-binding protein
MCSDSTSCVRRIASRSTSVTCRRLATTLVHDPEILFLDEPTTGVDPVSRRDFWEIVFDFLRDGVTIVVATPYLDEAERCERVALMHDGRLLDVDAPAALKAQLGGRMVEVRTQQQTQALDALRQDREVRDAQRFGRSIHALLTETAAYRRVDDRLRANGIAIESVRPIEPGLEDVFVALLGEDANTASSDSPNPTARSTGRRPASPRSQPEQQTTPIGPVGEPVIDVQGLTRRFGDFVAVDSVSFTVSQGEVFGFLGPNGSGKSTTIRMLTGILAPSGGRARLAGFDAAGDARRIRPLLGYMSQRFSLYSELTVSENLDFFAGLYGVRLRERQANRDRALEIVGLDTRASALAGDLPGGHRQRLALAAAVLHRPRILLLDEPTSGVDPLSRRKFWDLIFEMAGQGVTVLVTTHYMDEAERCHRVAILEGGQMIATGAPDELRTAVGGRMVEVAVPRTVAALRAAREAPHVRQVTLHGAALHVLLSEESDTAVAALRDHLLRAGHEPGTIAPASLTMEDVFAALVDQRSAAAWARS